MKKNFGIVAFMSAGIAALYFLARKNTPPGVQQLVPNADASGVGPNDPMNAGYNVGPYIPAPTPGWTYAPTNAQQYFFGDGNVPAFLNYNTPKGIPIPPPAPVKDDCCCGDQGNLKNKFTNTGSPMVFTAPVPPTLPAYIDNLQSTPGFHGIVFPSQQSIRTASGRVIH
jgi:hypothetical protein